MTKRLFLLSAVALSILTSEPSYAMKKSNEDDQAWGSYFGSFIPNILPKCGDASLEEIEDDGFYKIMTESDSSEDDIITMNGTINIIEDYFPKYTLMNQEKLEKIFDMTDSFFKKDEGGFSTSALKILILNEIDDE